MIAKDFQSTRLIPARRDPAAVQNPKPPARTAAGEVSYLVSRGQPA